MFHKYLIMTRGFKNLIQNGQTSGFQINIRIANYRGVALSLIGNVNLIVDGEEFPFEKIIFKYGRQLFTSNELKKASDVHWFFGDPLTLIINKTGGLKTGMHNIELTELIMTYYNELPVTAKKSMSLVQ